MPFSLDKKLVVAVTSRALFDFEAENKVFDSEGAAAYQKLQEGLIGKPATEGVAFPLVRKLLRFNSKDEQPVEVVVLSRNDPFTGIRVFESVDHHNLEISRGVFTQGRPPFAYLKPLKAKLFLSANTTDVQNALDSLCPAARVFSRPVGTDDTHPDELRIAFDGDAVLFSDEAEKIYQEKGLAGFQEHEISRADEPLPAGPFKPFLDALHALQVNSAGKGKMKIRTALVTARNAPAHRRALNTLKSWHVSVDEAMFLGGIEKGPFLEVFQPDFFFDDQPAHLKSAVNSGPTGHVDSGVANKRP